MSVTRPSNESALAAPFTGPMAWRAEDIAKTKWKYALDAACHAEIDDLVARLRRNALPTILLTPDDVDMPRCRETMRAVRDGLIDGSGIALVDRLPMERLTKEEAKTVYWVLSSMISRPVAQKVDGTMIYDIQDTGAKAAAGSGVRPDKTNIDLTFHNDNSYNNPMPDFVGLLCLQPAKRGGVSRLMSFETTYNALLERHRDALARLYEPFLFDRQKEHHPDEPATIAEPIFVEADGVKARLGLHQVRNGYEMSGEPMDTETARALAALEDIFADEALQIHFSMEAGQFQYANNLAIGHSRTEFTDFDRPEDRRHLVRLWMRDKGRRTYFGQ